MKWFLTTTFSSAMFLLPLAADADPPVIPDPPDVPCFEKTGARLINGGAGERIQFQVLNWTNTDAFGLKVTANTDPIVSTGVNTAGNNEMFAANAFGPNVGPFPGKLNTNDWTIFAADEFMVEWRSGTPLAFLDPFNPPIPVDSGINVLDGFLLDLPYLGQFERVVFSWELLGPNGQAIDPMDDPLGYRSGLYQIDRGPDVAINGILRPTEVVFFSLLGPINAVPLDIAATEQNAQVFPAIPVPASLVLLLSAVGVLLGGRMWYPSMAAA